MIYTQDIIDHLRKDPILRPVIDSTTLKEYLYLNDDIYFYLVRTITYQQLSGKAANTIFGRFLELFDDGYPHSEQILAMSIDDMRAVGLSRQKATYITNVAEFFVEHKLMNKDWTTETEDNILNLLTQIKGVGTWTVQMILMFPLQRLDVLPLGDLAIVNRMKELYGVEGKGRALNKELTEIAEAWRPYRTVACRYIWSWK